MTQFHPETPLTAVATFTLKAADGTVGPGKVKAGSIVWTGVAKDGSPTTDKITQVDAPDGGSSTASIDASAETDGSTTVYTCTANGNTGGGAPSLISQVSDVAEWTLAAAITADGETIGMSQSAPATPAQASAHRAGMAAR